MHDGLYMASARLRRKLGWLTLDWAARLTLAGVFIWAAIPKLLDPSQFAQDILNYHVFPAWAAQVSAIFVPVLELLTALCVLTGLWIRGASIIIGAMLVAFCILLMQAIFRGIRIDCGCFGSAAESEISWLSVLRNCGLLLCVGFILVYRKVLLSQEHKPS